MLLLLLLLIRNPSDVINIIICNILSIQTHIITYNYVFILMSVYYIYIICIYTSWASSVAYMSVCLSICRTVCCRLCARLSIGSIFLLRIDQLTTCSFQMFRRLNSSQPSLLSVYHPYHHLAYLSIVVITETISNVYIVFTSQPASQTTLNTITISY